jgi:hypothetical protein
MARFTTVGGLSARYCLRSSAFILAKMNEEFEVVVVQDCLQVDSGRLQLIASSRDQQARGSCCSTQHQAKHPRVYRETTIEIPTRI